MDSALLPREAWRMEMSGDPMVFPTAREWRAWLETNHATKDEAWLVINKRHAETRAVSLTEATEEGLCYGWIDSAMHPIDGERYALRYTPRRKGSKWSERNKLRAMRLIEEGRMAEAGLAAIEEAKRSGRWDGDG